MMKATELKKLLKLRFGVTCRVQSSTHYVNAWVPCVSNGYGPLTYDSPPFPLEFRQQCLRVVYGPDCHFADGGNAGNIRLRSIAMSRDEWTNAIATFAFVGFPLT
jgi:hypothetical protein